MRCLIDYSDVLIAGPTIEPLDLEEIKKNRRFSSTTLDTLFDIWNSGGRQEFEAMTNLALITQTREFALDASPCQDQIQLSRAPVQSIDSVTFDDGSGDEQTFAAENYTLLPKRDGATGNDPYPDLGCVALVSGASWPSTTGRKSLRIRYVCGFGDAPGAVPEIIVYYLHMFVGTAHKYGEGLQEPKTVLAMVPGVQQVLRNARTWRTIVPERW